MKVILTITTYSTDYNLLDYISNDYIDQIGSLLGYEIIKSTCGKHVDASRPHYHNIVCYDISGAKVYKTLNAKIKRLFTDLKYPTKEIGDMFRDTEQNLSFIYEGEQKKFKGKIKTYDESAMCYSYKEYKQDAEIHQEFQRGYSIPEIKEMRKVANVYWCEILRKRERQQQLEIEKKDEYSNMKEYLTNAMKDKSGDSNDLVKYIKKKIWEYKKDQYKKKALTSVRVGAIRDQAISFLVFNDYITIDETEDLEK